MQLVGPENNVHKTYLLIITHITCLYSNMADHSPALKAMPISYAKALNALYTKANIFRKYGGLINHGPI